MCKADHIRSYYGRQVGTQYAMGCFAAPGGIVSSIKERNISKERVARNKKLSYKRRDV